LQDAPQCRNKSIKDWLKEGTKDQKDTVKKIIKPAKQI
jgi:hypothetical protein